MRFFLPVEFLHQKFTIQKGCAISRNSSKSRPFQRWADKKIPDNAFNCSLSNPSPRPSSQLLYWFNSHRIVKPPKILATIKIYRLFFIYSISSLNETADATPPMRALAFFCFHLPSSPPSAPSCPLALMASCCHWVLSSCDRLYIYFLLYRVVPCLSSEIATLWRRWYLLVHKDTFPFTILDFVPSHKKPGAQEMLKST